MATLAAAVAEDGAAAVVTMSARTARDQDLLCELILLPLRHGDGAGFDRVLGSVAALERPYWLGSDPVVSQSIASLRLIWPDEAPTFMRRRSDQLAAESASAAHSHRGSRRKLAPARTLVRGRWGQTLTNGSGRRPW